MVVLGAVGVGFSESQRPQALDMESTKSQIARCFMRSGPFWGGAEGTAAPIIQSADAKKSDM